MTRDLSAVVEVPLETLYAEAPGFQNPRTTSGLDDAAIEELAADINHRGLVHPLLVWEIDEDCRVVISGQRRLRALQRLAESGIRPSGGVPVRIYDALTLDDARAEALADNVHRSQLSNFEVAEALAQMAGGVTEVAARTGMSTGHVSLLLTAYLDGPPEMVQRWKSGELSARSVYEAIEASGVGVVAAKRSPRPPAAVLRRIARRVEKKVEHQIRHPCDEAAGEYEYLDGLNHALRFATGGGEPDDERWREWTGRKS